MIIATLALLQTPPAESPSALVSKMVAKYSAAKTLTGTIQAVVSTGTEKVRVETSVVYVRPNRLSVRQKETYRSTRDYLLVSDGVGVVYTNPIEHLRSREPLLFESALREIPPNPQNPQPSKVSLSVPEIYALGSQSLADRSVPLDLAIARKEDLEFLRGQLMELKDGGLVEFNGTEARRIHGSWRPFAGAVGPMGQYELFITPDADLVGYRLTEPFRVEKRDVTLVSEWRANFQVNPPVEGSAFRLPRSSRSQPR